jgi:hypothetical protein
VNGVRFDGENFPRRISEVTTEWLAAQLGDAELEGFTLERIAEGVGFIGELYRLHLRRPRPATGPASVVVKVATPDPNAKRVAALFNFYGKEVGFYRELAERTATRTPRCHTARFDPDEQDFIIVMEDGGAGSLVDQIDGCDEAEVHVVVEEIAALHASWWQSPELDGIAWLQRWSHPLYTVGLPQGIEQTWRHAFDIFADSVPAWFLARWDQYRASLPDLLRRLDAMPRTLAHGDTRVDNLLFNAGDVPLMVLDWQVVVHGPGVFDVGYLLSQSVPVDVRRRIERDVLAFYRDCLLERGVSAPPMEDLWEGYRTSCLLAFVYPVIGGGNADPANERAVKLLRTVADRSVASIDDLGAMELL